MAYNVNWMNLKASSRHAIVSAWMWSQ